MDKNRDRVILSIVEEQFGPFAGVIVKLLLEHGDMKFYSLLSKSTPPSF